MVIANPIYDVVFKRLMENNRIAKFFIGTLLEQTIESVEVKPQEFTYTDTKFTGISVFRLDFLATIKTDTGELKKVLIEIQKAKNQVDLMRFRNYLGEQYKKEDIVADEKVVLPITTIYILGFNLSEIHTPCLKIDRNYHDLVNKQIITVKSEFVEKLTHDCYIVQVERITDKYQTRLDKLLSVFQQKYFIEDSKVIKEFKHNTDLEEVKIITDILHHAGTDPAERKEIEIEQEAWRTHYAMFENVLKELNESKKALTEKDLAITQKDLALSEKDLALKQKDIDLAEMKKELEALKRKRDEK